MGQRGVVTRGMLHEVPKRGQHSHEEGPFVFPGPPLLPPCPSVTTEGTRKGGKRAYHISPPNSTLGSGGGRGTKEGNMLMTEVGAETQNHQKEIMLATEMTNFMTAGYHVKERGV